MHISEIKHLLKSYPDFPKPGILFQDVFAIFKKPEAIKAIVDHLVEVLKPLKVDAIVGLEARGFLLGPWIAANLGVAFVPIRKKNKLPGQLVSVSYEKEYGVDVFEIQEDCFDSSKTKNSIPNVVVIDDLLATGGTAFAAKELIEKVGGNVVLFAFIIELLDLEGSSKIGKDITYSITKF